MLEWLIVGGGIHGTHLSHVLTREMKVPRDLVRVLDPREAPLARWEECTTNTGMRLLRSSHVHHIDTHPFSLRKFSHTPKARGLGGLVGHHRRPTLALFHAHYSEVVREHGLSELRIRGRATGLRRCKGGYRLQTEDGSLHARRVLLAMGASDQPHWPEWARSLHDAGGAVHHVFEPGFRREALPEWERAVVLGGGITAAQTALSLAERRPGSVTLLTRHPVRVRQFDSDPGWIGPRFQEALRREADLGRRREVILRARHRGSMPPDVAAELRRGLTDGTLSQRVGKVVDAAVESGQIDLRLEGGGAIRTDRLILATGFDARRPGGAWLDEVIDELGLRCADCGYPVVDRALRWGEEIYVTGPLAELEIGPVARNIVGARITAERLRTRA